MCTVCEQRGRLTSPPTSYRIQPYRQGKPDCPSLHMQRAHSYRARCASKTGRQALLYRFSLHNHTTQRDGETSRPLLRASTEHILIVRGLRARRLPISPARSSTLPSREESLTALHCARSTSTVFACALREQDRASGLPLSSIPIPPAHTPSPSNTDRQS